MDDIDIDLHYEEVIEKSNEVKDAQLDASFKEWFSYNKDSLMEEYLSPIMDDFMSFAKDIYKRENN